MAFRKGHPLSLYFPNHKKVAKIKVAKISRTGVVTKYVRRRYKRKEPTTLFILFFPFPTLCA